MAVKRAGRQGWDQGLRSPVAMKRTGRLGWLGGASGVTLLLTVLIITAITASGGWGHESVPAAGKTTTQVSPSPSDGAGAAPGGQIWDTSPRPDDGTTGGIPQDGAGPNRPGSA